MGKRILIINGHPDPSPERFCAALAEAHAARAEPGVKGGFRGLLKGLSVRLMVTMGMPAPIYRLAFGGFGVRALERGVLRLARIGPIRHDYVGMVEGSAEARMSWLNHAPVLGLTGR